MFDLGFLKGFLKENWRELAISAAICAFLITYFLLSGKVGMA